MITNYYTLAALVEEWKPWTVRAVLVDAYSQSRGELSLAFENETETFTLRISVSRPLLYAFRTHGSSRARRNTTPQFETALGRRVTDIRITTGDRILIVALEGGLALHAYLFGPRANVFLMDTAGTVLESFKGHQEVPPLLKPAPSFPSSVQAFSSRWQNTDGPAERRLMQIWPYLDRTLAAEVFYRAGSGTDVARVFGALEEVVRDLEHPQPVHLMDGPVRSFSLIPLESLPGAGGRVFESVDEAVRRFVQDRLARDQFLRVYAPLEKELGRLAVYHRNRIETMLAELSKKSRADRYERWGHLLMANPDLPITEEVVRVPDLFGTGDLVEIPVDAARTPVENARVYYEKARAGRQAREHAERRLLDAERDAVRAEKLLERVRAAASVDELKALRTEARPVTGEAVALPYRVFRLPGGYQALVGRGAAQNDELTLHHARKDDLWLHARGVAGSHVVVRIPARAVVPGREVLEAAASLAAFFSKARGSGLVPVMVTRRKYVRKPKGAAPGAVLVEREKVLIVPPRLPEPVRPAHTR